MPTANNQPMSLGFAIKQHIWRKAEQNEPWEEGEQQTLHRAQGSSETRPRWGWSSFAISISQLHPGLWLFADPVNSFPSFPASLFPCLAASQLVKMVNLWSFFFHLIILIFVNFSLVSSSLGGWYEAGSCVDEVAFCRVSGKKFRGDFHSFLP